MCHNIARTLPKKNASLLKFRDFLVRWYPVEATLREKFTLYDTLLFDPEHPLKVPHTIMGRCSFPLSKSFFQPMNIPRSIEKSTYLFKWTPTALIIICQFMRYECYTLCATLLLKWDPGLHNSFLVPDTPSNVKLAQSARHESKVYNSI